MKFYNEISLISDELEPLRIKYVPRRGKADTVGGEIIRAIDELVYQFYGEGNQANLKFGTESCNASYTFLKNILEWRCPTLYDARYTMDTIYERALLTIMTNINKYLKENPKVFSIHNTIDSRGGYK